MATYTPLQQGQAATFGTSGQAVSQYQQQLNTQNQGKAGWKPLVVDGKFGPLTQAAASFKPSSQLVVTSNPARMEGMKYSNELSKAMQKFNIGTAQPGQEDPNADPEKATIDNYSDPYTKTLDKQMQMGDDLTKAMIQSIKSKNQQTRVQAAGQYDNYKRGLQLLGIQHNQAESTPDILLGHIQNAENELTSKLDDLDAEENKALLEARSAEADKKTRLLKEKMDYVKSIQKEREDVLKNAYEKMSYQAKISETQAGMIYGELQKLGAADKEAFLQAVAQQFNIPLGALVQAVADEHTARTKKTGTGTAQSKKDDIAQSVYLMKKYQTDNQQAGIDPQVYEHYRKQIVAQYGYAAGAELDKQMEDAGLSVDNG